MSDNTYQPPKVWEWKQNNGGAFANINRPVSGATHEKELPVGAHPLQLYSLVRRMDRKLPSCWKSCWRWA